MVDGTSAMLDDEGFIFLFNPSMRPLNATLTLDESVGLSNASAGRAFNVTQLFPRVVSMGDYSHAKNLTVALEGSSALVLSLSKAPSRAAGGGAKLAVVGLTGGLDGASTRTLAWTGAEGLAGSTVTASLSGGVTANPTMAVRVNGVGCAPTADGGAPRTLSVTFEEGPVVQHAQPLGPLPPSTNVGGKWTAAFAISSAVFDQLAARQVAYPVPWTAAERNATWLVPSRLLAYIMIANPSDNLQLTATIDGVAVPIHRSYNSRGLVRPRCFLGYYLDLSALKLAPDVDHTLELGLPALGAGAFEGIFLENVETAYTSAVRACHVSSSMGQGRGQVEEA